MQLLLQLNMEISISNAVVMNADFFRCDDSIT